MLVVRVSVVRCPMLQAVAPEVPCRLPTRPLTSAPL